MSDEAPDTHEGVAERLKALEEKVFGPRVEKVYNTVTAEESAVGDAQNPPVEVQTDTTDAVAAAANAAKQAEKPQETPTTTTTTTAGFPDVSAASTTFSAPTDPKPTNAA